MAELDVGGRTVEVSNTDKVFFPDAGITKGDLIDYYRRIAPRMLPHLADRPLVLVRYPNGIEGKRFFQKRVPEHFPEWIDRADVPQKQGGSITHAVCNDAATVVYLANQACIELHPWLSREDKPDHPDQMIFDLDPADDDFESVRDAAGMLHELLDELELPSFCKTTGSRGLHIMVPLDRSADFDRVREVARRIAEVATRRAPDSVTMNPRKEQRAGRLLIDTGRNAYGQTAVAPYSIRAKPGAPVATPIEWAELTKRLTARRYTIKNIFRRLTQKTDPWSQIHKRACSLEAATKRLEKLQTD